jgi:hypothetical protein
MQTDMATRRVLWPTRQFVLGTMGGMLGGMASTLIMVQQGGIKATDFIPCAVMGFLLASVACGFGRWDQIRPSR